MSDSHNKLPKLFWVQLALAAIIGIIFLTTPSKHDEENDAKEAKVATVEKNLKPVGTVSTKEAKAANSTKARSGEEIYKATCMACHANGVANAPKPDDKAAWEPRVATGLDALIKTAINGKGAMPARGGNPALTDEEIKAVILYMTGKAGFDLSSPKKKEPTNIATTETKIDGEKVYKATCMACHASGVANAPKPDDKAAWKPRVATGLDALMKTAINGKGAMPARGGNPALTDEEIKAVILYMTGKAGFDLNSTNKKEPTNTAMTETKKGVEKVVEKSVEKVLPAVATVIPVAPSAPVAPVAPKTMEEEPAKPKAPKATPEIESEVVAAAPAANNIKGEKIYKETCFSCHDVGIANSPKLGDKAAWSTRIASGKDALYTSAISGKGVMPPKGGNMGLSDDDIKAVVDYMIAQSR